MGNILSVFGALLGKTNSALADAGREGGGGANVLSQWWRSV